MPHQKTVEQKRRVLIVFGSPFLYGAERTEIENFDVLRPDVQPHFLVSPEIRKNRLPIYDAILGKRFSHSFFSNHSSRGWPRMGKPRSFGHLTWILSALFRSNLDVLRALRRQHAIYIPDISALYGSLVACLVARVTGRPVIFRFHSLMEQVGPRNFFLQLASLLVSAFVHNTEFSRITTMQANPWLKDKQNRIIPPMTLPRSLARPLDEPIGQSAEELASKTTDVISQFYGKRNIIFVGQVAPHKGVNLLVEAFLQVGRDYQDAHLHIVGGGEPVFISQMQALAANCKMERRVHFWGYQEEIQLFLHYAYLLAVPTIPSLHEESFGRAVVEAMSVGVPSVCFPSGALQEVVLHEETGLLCANPTIEDLAKGLCRLLNDSGVREEYGRRALQRYEDNYSPEHVRGLWLKLLEEIS